MQFAIQEQLVLFNCMHTDESITKTSLKTTEKRDVKDWGNDRMGRRLELF